MIKRDKVYDLYWCKCYYKNVEKIDYKNVGFPLTNDHILQKYKFCNDYRVNDRVSQYLLKNVIYNGKIYESKDIIFRIILFKLFNKESTWELLFLKIFRYSIKNI